MVTFNSQIFSDSEYQLAQEVVTELATLKEYRKLGLAELGNLKNVLGIMVSYSKENAKKTESGEKIFQSFTKSLNDLCSEVMFREWQVLKDYKGGKELLDNLGTIKKISIAANEKKEQDAKIMADFLKDSKPVSQYGSDPNRKEKILEDINKGFRKLGELDMTWRTDFDVVMAAVSKDGKELDKASDSLKNDPALVAAANGKMESTIIKI
jgi:hypothetical protein